MPLNALLPPTPLLCAFLIASVILAVTPRPGVFYIVTRALAQGRRAGLVSVGGVALGNFSNAIAAATGLAALFSVSSIAFILSNTWAPPISYGLALKALRAPQGYEVCFDSAKDKSDHFFRDGVAVALLNPKTAIFFAAFRPQFLTASDSAAIQSIVLSALFVGSAAVTDSFYALAAGAGAPALMRTRAVRVLGRHATASALIALGVFTAIAGSHQTSRGI